MGFQETLRRLAMIDEGFVADRAGLALGLTGTSALDAKTASLLQVGVSVALGSAAVSLEWSTARTRSPTCCWPSPRSRGSTGSSLPPPAWEPHWGMTSKPHWRNQAISDGS